MLRMILKYLLPVVFLCLAIIGFRYLSQSTPPTAKEKKNRQPPLVSLVPLPQENPPVTIAGWGHVSPVQQIQLNAAVSGRIIRVADAFTPGGIVVQGTPLVWIDPQPYSATVDRLQAQLAAVQADLRIEKGKQRIAAQELALAQAASAAPLTDTALILREPQYQKAEAAVAAARAAVDQARLDLDNTCVRAPFTGVLQSIQMHTGSHVSPGTSLAVLTGSDAAQVTASVPLHTFHLIDWEKETAVQITGPSGVQRRGTLLRWLPTLSKATRMAEIVIRLPDPLGIDSASPSLPFQSYVHVAFTGKTLPGARLLPRRLLRRNDAVWLYQGGRLTVYPVTVIHQHEDQVWIRTTFPPEASLIATDLTAPVPGMRLGVKPDQTGDVPPVSGDTP
ncbi:MAG: hypothetical protein CSA22_02415 [Deltaproteobacteria bacterium]|nr:MAG: hypothetical protein CSA22_02415 [Deltaproteobacteria bacterium]